MRSHPEIGIWELVSGTPCFGPHLILCGQNPLTAWYLGPDTSSLAVSVSVRNITAPGHSRIIFRARIVDHCW